MHQFLFGKIRSDVLKFLTFVTMAFSNPGGHNYGPMNLDGWAILQIALTIIYTIVVYSLFLLFWSYRKHPAIIMGKV